MAPDRCASALGGAAPLAGGHRSSGAGNGSNAGAISARTMAGNRGARGVLHRVPVDCRFKYCITRRHLYGSCGADSLSGLFYWTDAGVNGCAAAIQRLVWIRCRRSDLCVARFRPVVRLFRRAACIARRCDCGDSAARIETQIFSERLLSILGHFSMRLHKAQARRQYGERCGRSRSSSRSDGGDPAAGPYGERIIAQGKPLKNALMDHFRSAPRQLLLDFGAPPAARFDQFVAGANAELVSQLSTLSDALMTGGAPERLFYLWGAAGSGRSHLLHALCADAGAARARLLGPHSPRAAFEFDAAVAIYALDDCDALSAAQQSDTFTLFNEVRAHPRCALVAAGNAPPRALALREDLRSRLGWGLVFQLAPLDDAHKREALARAARARGLALSADVSAYLLTHFKRELPALMALLDALDRFSLEHQRAVTLPLVRAWREEHPVK